MGRRRKSKQLTPAQIRTAQAQRLSRERKAAEQTVHLEPAPDTSNLFYGDNLKLEQLEPAGPVDTLPEDIPHGIIVNKWPIQSWADVTHHVALSQTAYDWVTAEIERNRPALYNAKPNDNPVVPGFIAEPPATMAANISDEEQKIRRRRLIGLGVIKGQKYERSIKPIKPTPEFGQVTVAYDGIKDLVLLISACQNCHRGHRTLGHPAVEQMMANWNTANTQDELENMAQALLNFALKIATFDDIKLVADHFGLAINYYGWDNRELMNAKRKALIAQDELIAATKPQ